MQVIKLVHPGRVDKVMAFDELPKDLLEGVRTYAPHGFPRHWKQWLKDVGSKTKIKYEVDGKKMEREEECFFGIEYVTINKDKERWQEIVGYVRRNCDPSIRLLDKFEDMAKPLAPDSMQPLSLEPEEVPIISIKKALVLDEDKKEIIDTVVDEVKDKLQENKKTDFVCSTCGKVFPGRVALMGHSRSHRYKEKAVIQT
jgi:hypothetical protein